MDVLVPKVGELVGGAQREERRDVLQERMAEMGISEKSLWYEERLVLNIYIMPVKWIHCVFCVECVNQPLINLLLLPFVIL